MSRELLAALFLPPLRAQRSRIAAALGSLAVLGLANGLVLLMVNGFVKALFQTSGGSDALIPLAELVPAGVLRALPWLSSQDVTHAQLSIAVPLVLLGAGLLRAMATYLYQLHQQALALFLAKHYREQLFGALMGLSYTEIRRRSPGEWMSVIMNDVMFLQGRFSELMTGLVRDVVVVSSCFFVLLFLHWQTALGLLLIAPFIAYGMGRTGKRIAHFAEAVQREMARIAAAILDLRARFDFIRSQNGERLERARFEAVNQAYYAMISRSIMIRSAFAPVLEFIGFALFAFFVYAAGSGIWGGEFSPELMMQFFVALGLLVKPLKGIGEQLSRFAETKGSLNDSLAIFCSMAQSQSEQLPPPAASLEAAPRAAVANGLMITRVELGFGGVMRFAATDLALMPGCAVAIIGPSGAGKSTLLKALGGLVAPYLWEANRSWQEAVASCSMVSQEPFLFDDTLRENLLYGLSEEKLPAEDDVWDVLRTVNMAAEVRALPEGLETRVRAIASNFSGGQVQRLVIARALLRRKPLLALDEATSAIDIRSERDITMRLIDTCRTKKQALIAVTHRLQWLDVFDEVWFVENGKVLLKGSHAQLMNQARYRAYCESAGLKLDESYIKKDVGV